MKISHIIILSIVLFFGTGCNKGNTEEMGNGLIIEDLVVGEGAEAQDYNKVVVNYTGSLEDGSVFDSSLNPGRAVYIYPGSRLGYKRLGLRRERNESWR